MLERPGSVFEDAEPRFDEGSKYTHYDNPSRRDKKIYTVDFDGGFVERCLDDYYGG